MRVLNIMGQVASSYANRSTSSLLLLLLLQLLLLKVAATVAGKQQMLCGAMQGRALWHCDLQVWTKPQLKAAYMAMHKTQQDLAGKRT